MYKIRPEMSAPCNSPSDSPREAQDQVAVAALNHKSIIQKLNRQRSLAAAVSKLSAEDKPFIAPVSFSEWSPSLTSVSLTDSSDPSRNIVIPRLPLAALQPKQVTRRLAAAQSAEPTNVSGSISARRGVSVGSVGSITTIEAPKGTLIPHGRRSDPLDLGAKAEKAGKLTERSIFRANLPEAVTTSSILTPR